MATRPGARTSVEDWAARISLMLCGDEVDTGACSGGAAWNDCRRSLGTVEGLPIVGGTKIGLAGDLSGQVALE